MNVVILKKEMKTIWVRTVAVKIGVKPFNIYVITEVSNKTSDERRILRDFVSS